MNNLILLSYLKFKKEINLHFFTVGLKYKPTHLVIIRPHLVASHTMAANQFDWTTGIGRVKAVVIGHNLLPLGVCKDLKHITSIRW